MITTNHCYARMSQRGLSKKLIDLTLEFGKVSGDKLVFNKKTAQKIIAEMDLMRKELLRIVDKGGITVIIDNSTLITAYNTDSFKRN
jgi:hypothetical protein